MSRIGRIERALDARPRLRWALVGAAALLQAALLTAEALSRPPILHVVLAVAR